MAARQKSNAFRLVLLAITTFSPSTAIVNGTYSISTARIVASPKATFAPLLPPLYRNASAGSVWVYPSSKYDLGARDMGCECFDPESM